MPLSALTLALLLATHPAQPAPPSSVPEAAPSTAPIAAADGFWVRPGYEVSVAVETIPGARFMEVDDHGVLYVSRPRPGDIIALRDADGDGVYEQRQTYTSGKPRLHGLCYSGGWLWFTTTGSIHKARDTDGDLIADEVVDVLAPGTLVTGGGHWWRSLLVTKDTLYTSIGDGGNISDQTDTDRQKIFSFALDGSGKQLFASGIRNTEKLRLRPGTSEIWGFDHGSDWFGREAGDTEGDQPITDLNPPEELNLYTQSGFYGHPFIVGNRIPRYEYFKREGIHDLARSTIPPEWTMGAHWAPNGFCFIDPALSGLPRGIPAGHAGDCFVACHGSWNSTEPVGYCIARVLFDKETGKPYGLLKIVSTIEPETRAIKARPVDCVQAADGSLLFSSDQPGRIYRLRTTPSAASTGASHQP
ncbi:MAG: hypothetical protein H7Y88_07285 [Phycisphaerales bacterium]|nr:hypothetical protein [Phycisphaerales bacterium]